MAALCGKGVLFCRCSRDKGGILGENAADSDGQNLVPDRQLK